MHWDLCETKYTYLTGWYINMSCRHKMIQKLYVMYAQEDTKIICHEDTRWYRSGTSYSPYQPPVSTLQVLASYPSSFSIFFLVAPHWRSWVGQHDGSCPTEVLPASTTTAIHNTSSAPHVTHNWCNHSIGYQSSKQTSKLIICLKYTFRKFSWQ